MDAVLASEPLLKQFYRNHQQAIHRMFPHSFTTYEEFKAISYTDLIRLRLQAQRDYQVELLQSDKIEIRHIEGEKPVLVVNAWILSDRALFSFKPTAKVDSLCFKTDDRRLVDMLGRIFEHSWALASIVAPAEVVAAGR